MMSLAFLLALVLHNMEAAIWMPELSKEVKRIRFFGLKKKRFLAAIILITFFAYGLTYVYFIDNGASETIRYLYMGFIFIVGLNAFFPYLFGSIYFRKYIPGTATSCLFTLPISFYLVFVQNKISPTDIKLYMGSVIILVILFSMLMLVKKLYKITRKALRKCLKMVFPVDE